MINQILNTIEEYVSARSAGKSTLEYRKKFSTVLLNFIDYRIKAELKHQKRFSQIKAIDVLIEAPDPNSPNFFNKYKEWYQTRIDFLNN